MVFVITVLVYAEQAIRSNLPVETITVHCYNKCDWEALQEDMMNVPWEKIEKYEDINQAWIDDDIWKLMRERHWMLCKYLKTRDHDLWNAYKRLRYLVTTTMRVVKTTNLIDVCNDFRNPKKAWIAIKNLRGKQHKETIQAIMTDNGEVTDDLQIVEVFNEYFTSLFAGSTAVSDRNLKESETSFQFCKLNVEDTLEVLQSLDVDKATGLDGISAKCLRFTAPMIAGSLNHLFNLSLI